jgi:anion-transporting  ArsA/GET3 family ATPase
MWELIKKRLVLIGGKGGVGKTTIATALARAIAARDESKRVLLLGINSTLEMAAFLESGPIEDEIVSITNNLMARRLDPFTILNDYIAEKVKIGFLAKRITDSNMYHYFTLMAPAIKEFFILNEIWRLEQKRNKKGGPEYDYIIVDAPPAGHGTTFLGIPKAARELIRTGPLQNMAEKIYRLLQDPARTAVLIVTLAEELPVRESLDFRKKILYQLEIPLAGIVINSVYPNPFRSRNHMTLFSRFMADTRDRQLLADQLFPAGQTDTLDMLLREVESRINWRNIHEAHIAYLKEHVREPMIEVPFIGGGAFTRETLDEIGRYLFPDQTLEL